MRQGSPACAMQSSRHVEDAMAARNQVLALTRELFKEGRSVSVRDDVGKRFGLEEIKALALKLPGTA